jgi:hypothetical protein
MVRNRVAENVSGLAKSLAVALLPGPATSMPQPLDTSSVKVITNLSEDEAAVQQRSLDQLNTDPLGVVVPQ